jgi:peptidoglycan/xylan/chitin deacetylase (PgdA/CDA1 family)
MRSRLRVVPVLTALGVAGGLALGAVAGPGALAQPGMAAQPGAPGTVAQPGATAGSRPQAEGPADPSAVLAGGRPAAWPATGAARAAAGCIAVPGGASFYAPGAPGGGKTVALTFDDGPGPSTAPIIAVLRQYGVTGTFFNIGQNAARYPSLVRQEATLGYQVGNHTWDHPDMNGLPAGSQASEMDEATAEQQGLIGWGPCAFRPPYGNYNSALLSLAQQRNMRVWNWSVDTEDWKAAGSGASSWVSRIVSLAESEGGPQAHPVILMHNAPSGDPATVAALPAIIRYFKSRGYAFVNLAGSPGTGYQVLTAGGYAYGFGAPGYGSAGGKLPAGVAAVGLAADPGTGGYWLLASNGAVTAYHAPALGSAAGKLPAGVTATAIAAGYGGYVILASDGGVYAFGAPLHGSARGKLAAGTRAAGIAADAATGGYWILSSSGWVASFGAPAKGSAPLRAGETATAIAASPQGGYLVLTSAGRVVALGGKYLGQVAGKLAQGVTAVGLAVAPATGGYWILASDGGVTAYGAPGRGSVKIPAGQRATGITGI